MKFSLLTLIAAGAALIQVGASPIRVVVVGGNVPDNFRFGHAISASNISAPNVNIEDKSHRPCRLGRFRVKALKLSNSFRKAVGLPLIESPHSQLHDLPKPAPGRVTIFGTPTFVPDGKVAHHHHDRPMHRIHKHDRLYFHNGTFMDRLHIALMALGPWEGRAVAFVLGCGIGVLLRMIWVLAVVTYRVIKGPREEERQYTEIFVVEEYNDGEDIAPAPPTYTYPDEKAEAKKADTLATESSN